MLNFQWSQAILYENPENFGREFRIEVHNQNTIQILGSLILFGFSNDDTEPWRQTISQKIQEIRHNDQVIHIIQNKA